MRCHPGGQRLLCPTHRGVPRAQHLEGLGENLANERTARLCPEPEMAQRGYPRGGLSTGPYGSLWSGKTSVCQWRRPGDYGKASALGGLEAEGVQDLCPGVSAANSPESQPVSPLGAGLATDQTLRLHRPLGQLPRAPGWWPSLLHWPARQCTHPCQEAHHGLGPSLCRGRYSENDCQAVEPGKAD